MFSRIIENLYSSVTSISFDTLVWIILGTFLGITALIVILVFAVPKIRVGEKRPYLCLVNAYTAVVLAAFLSKQTLAQSALAAVIFWCLGYFLYGVLCFISKPQKEETTQVSTLGFLPASQSRTVQPPHTDVPAAKSSVRLEHAKSVTERLLQKNLGKSDRQELEKLKTTLSVLETKGTLTPAESDILNENFNALLKLMAKYNI